MKKLTDTVILIGEWIIGCKTEDQIRNLVNLYETIISKQFHPEIDDDSISDSLFHLDQMASLQIKEITKHYAGINNQL